MGKNWCDKLSFSIFPARCLLCEASSALSVELCYNCLSLLRRQSPYCRHCGLNLPDTHNDCGRCLQQPPAFDRCISGCDFHRLSAALIHRFKDHKQLPPLRILSTLLADEILQSYCDETLPQLIIPVPLHWQRLWTRGFNQSQWIAHALSQQLNIPISNHGVKRLYATPQQRKLNKRQRLGNLKDAFQVTADYSRYQHIAIVDDVITTGSTAQGMALQLKQHGVPVVDCWSLARTPEPGSRDG
ncbi:ComF family protein [Sinobacterium caligoides]|uniref:ComF family protein n=2 Tax=Sinobacterium caligoides TaxID=933926 RepID=A0A3N2DRK3_9GAMM|nr:ComF family protein [Sinobacterium caligoides]